MGCQKILGWLLKHRLSVAAIVFYATEYCTIYVRAKYWKGSFFSSFANDPYYFGAVIAQLIINAILCLSLIAWLMLKSIRLDRRQPTFTICCVLIIALLFCELIITLQAGTEQPSSVNHSFLCQLFIDLFACTFSLIYFSFPREIRERADTESGTAQAAGDIRATPNQSPPAAAAEATPLISLDQEGNSLTGVNDRQSQSIWSRFSSAFDVPVIEEYSGTRLHEDRWFIVISCILQFALLGLGLAVNVIREVKMVEMDFVFLATVVENILLFEIFHHGIQLAKENGARDRFFT